MMIKEKVNNSGNVKGVTARQVAFDMLFEVLEEGAYSNLALSSTFDAVSFPLDSRDKAFAAAIYYMVLRKKVTVDYLIGRYCTNLTQKLDKRLLIILEMGFCQLLYLGSVPDSAAVNESVELTRYAGCPEGSRLVNGVLRTFIRDEKYISLPSKGRKKQLSIEYSCPEWLVGRWIADYGEHETEIILKQTQRIPGTTIRVNTQKISVEKLVEMFLQEKLCLKPIEGILEAYWLPEGEGSIDRMPGFKEGLFHVQDTASQLACAALGVKPGQTVIDICAAPGGKSFTLAQQMNNQGKIFAFDLHESRVELIREGARRLGLNIIEARTADSSVFMDELPMADKVICDVPCFGLGVIRRKPEIKLKSKGILSELPQLQLKLLSTASRYVKMGGELLYSTCSLSRSENEEVAKKFLDNNTEFKPVPFLQELGEPFCCSEDGMVTVLPGVGCNAEGDGFFIAKFIRSESVI